MSKYMTRVNVFNQRAYTTPNKLVGFKTWVDSLLDGIPEEFHPSAEIAIESGEEWGSTYTDVIVFYYRPETKEERKAARRALAAAQEETKRRELALLASLQQKYEGEKP